MTDEPNDASKALVAAEREARKTRGLANRARRLVAELRFERSENHFSPAIEQAFGRRQAP